MQASPTTSAPGSCSAFDRERGRKPLSAARPVRRLELLLLLLTAALSACPSNNDRPIGLVEVRIHTERTEPTASPPVPFDKAKAEQHAVATIEKLPGYAFRHPKADESRWEYLFTIDLTAERLADGSLDGQMKHRAVGGRLELKEAIGDGYYETTFLETIDEPASVPFDALVAKAITKAAEQLAISMKLVTGSDDELIALLDSPDDRIKGQAIGLAGKRKLAKAAPKLMQLVRDKKSSEDLVLVAIGSLVQIGDQEASSAIIDASKNLSAESQLPLLFALSQLGGLEAEAFLFQVSSNHSNEVIRQSAADALQELESRRAEKKKLESPP